MHAHFEPIGGASGDMLLGALIDAGADVATIERGLQTIPVSGWHLGVSRVDKRGIAATSISFNVAGEDCAPGERQPARSLREVLAIVDASGLTPAQKARATAIYTKLGAAEAHVHGTSTDAIHFHEVGAVDAILDVAAFCIAFDALEIDGVSCAPLPVGSGAIAMHHGRYPNPPPATAELLRGFATYDAGIAGEMVTTTGAAILSTVCTPGERPPLVTQRIGYGAGNADFTIPNVLRVSLGDLASAQARSTVAVLEANIDDMSPQYVEIAIERLFAAGAVDVWISPISMKKSRPAFTLSAIAPLACEAACARTMLAETSTIGVRVRHEHRYEAERSIETVATPLGPVSVKTARFDGTVRRRIEYDDLARIARETGRPIADIAAELEKALVTE